MSLAVVSHPACERYSLPAPYPDQPGRLDAVNDQLIASGLDPLVRHVEAKAATDAQITALHAPQYLADLARNLPESGWSALDRDTLLVPGSLEAARGAAGAALRAAELAMSGEAEAAFALTRPPGHHAGTSTAGGFCLLNHVAIAAHHARRNLNAERIAIVDFDAHHGDGTEGLVADCPEVRFFSLYQEGGFGAPAGPAPANSSRIPLPVRCTGIELDALARDTLFPALNSFQPDLLLFSAGFDGHRDEDLSDLRLSEGDFSRLVTECRAASGTAVPPPTGLVLEGGYIPDVLGRCVTAVIKGLLTP
ncbi:histone deacetylase family protein [Thiohalorhabdus methylotrophus]|uniref:Histone deacetylase family protein n=1 Tax=Thiohalorhabdus methylotrophus TaxID=3242694 RepID=A0ABV4TY95_9GAMM